MTLNHKHDDLLYMLAEQKALLQAVMERLEKQEIQVSRMDDRIARKIDATQSCLLGRIDKIDDRLRCVERTSAVYGTTSGAIMSIIITLGLRLLLGRTG